MKDSEPQRPESAGSTAVQLSALVTFPHINNKNNNNKKKKNKNTSHTQQQQEQQQQQHKP